MLSRVGKMLPSLSGGGLYGAGYPAGQVLGGETSGFAIDFTSPGANLLMRSGTIPGNYVGYPFVREGGPVAFSRASNATVTDSNGYIKWAAHNLLTNSESFDAATWTKSAATVSANVAATTAPNSTSTADKIAEDATTASHRVQQGFNATIGATYTLSVFAKSAERSWLQILTNSFSSGNQAANFNLSNGTVGTGATGANLTKTITSIGSGWYLCTITWTPDATGSNVYFYILDSDAATGASYAGVSGNGIYLWGAHLYRSDLGGMVANTSAYPYYNPTTPKNLLGYTENITVAPWFAGDVTRASDVAIAPNGLQTADSITDNTATAAHLISQTQAVNAGPKTVSIYAKANTWNFIQLSFGSAASGRANFDLTNGVAGSTDHTSSITSVGNGWYRCSVTLTTTAANLETYVGLVTSNTAARLESYAGTGSRSAYLWGAQLSDSASLDTYVPNHFAAPTAAAYYGPRLDYDGSTLAAKGLLVEEQRTNLLLRSAEFNDAAWVKSSSGTGSVPVVTANADTAPDGSLTADRVDLNAGAGTTSSDVSLLRQITTVTSATAYSGSFYVKAATASDVGKTIGFRHVANGSYTVVTLTSTWMRISLAETSISTTGNFDIACRGGLTSASASVLVWGAQLEAGSFATSYIPTGSATVTRSADVAQVSTQAFPYSGTEGTLVISTGVINDAVYPTVGSLSDTTANNVILLQGSSTGANMQLYVVSGGSVVVNTSAQVFSLTSAKTAAAYKLDDYAYSTQGAAPTADTSATVPTMNTLHFGSERGVANWLNGCIRQITYIPRRLTNAELQSRTT